ncbi:hypothetical protein NUH88_20055 [Nisaea acidiphila]|uniref:Uncharacterized protein n=1 Tax=Nisaea acidiphila TaxID=1862145 RepID=A0A9J7AR12_9PROT|nr:hypothetical protein [Nisaea acidiphila]UUX49679.1 hypothetical protein NUH88_20055 [Nisaea acidiphila]
MSISYTHSIFETHNARHIEPSEVAKTFVPPDSTYSNISSNNNHIVIGPRGSGKTTLFKMLTIPALVNWRDFNKFDIYPKVDFIGIFVPADRSWQAQIRSKTGDAQKSTLIMNAAFTTHVLLSFMNTLIQLNELDLTKSKRINFDVKKINNEQESEISRQIADAWRLDTSIYSFRGIIASLRKRLISIGEIKEKIFYIENYSFDEFESKFIYLTFRDTLLYAIDIYANHIGNQSLRWALLFDEFEIAPTDIQKEVLSNLRGQSDPKLIFKIALAMYNRNIEDLLTDEHAASAKNDFQVEYLWHARKDSGHRFSAKLVQRMLQDSGYDSEEMSTFLGNSLYDFEDDDTQSPYSDDGKVLQAYMSLEKSDPSFKSWLASRNVNLNDLTNLNGIDRASTIRKIRSIALTREYFRRFTDDRSDISRGRSRKVDQIYIRHPSLLSLCEGNPRFTLAIFSPLIRELMITRAKHAKRPVSDRHQSEQVRSTLNAFRAFLKTIPYQPQSREGNRGLLSLLDKVGNHFYQKCVVEEFNPQPPLTFIVDSHIDEETHRALGRAVNAGAIVYVPDKGAEPLLSSLRGKRFRLSFLLSTYYKIPLILGTEISLARILDSGPRDTGKPSAQISIFDESNYDD